MINEFKILLAEINIYLLMMNDSFTALRQIILTSGTLLKEDLHKVCSCFCFEVFLCYKYGKLFHVALLNIPSLPLLEDPRPCGASVCASAAAVSLCAGGWYCQWPVWQSLSSPRALPPLTGTCAGALFPLASSPLLRSVCLQSRTERSQHHGEGTSLTKTFLRILLSKPLFQLVSVSFHRCMKSVPIKLNQMIQQNNPLCSSSHCQMNVQFHNQKVLCVSYLDFLIFF